MGGYIKGAVARDDVWGRAVRGPTWQDCRWSASDFVGLALWVSQWD